MPKISKTVLYWYVLLFLILRETAFNAQLVDCRKWFEGDEHKAHTSCMTEAEAYQGKLYNPKIKNKDLFNKDIPTIPWVGWKRTIRKLVKRQEKKYIDKKILKERVLASFKKYKQDDFDPRDANVKFFLKLNKTKNLKVSGNKIIYEREE